MKVFRILFVVLVMLFASLSSVRVAHAGQWELDYNEIIWIGPNDTFWHQGGVNWSEDLIELGGGITFETTDLYGELSVNRDRTTRVHYKWTGGGTPTSITHVDVSWFYSQYRTGEAEYNDYWQFGSLLSGPSNMDSGMYAASVVRTGNTAHIDVGWSYRAEFIHDNYNLGGGSISVGFGTGTPY